MHCCFQGDHPSFDSAEAMRSRVRVLKELVGSFKSGSLGDSVRRSAVEQLSMQIQDLSLLMVLEDDVNLAEELIKEIMVWIEKDPCVHGGRHSSHGKPYMLSPQTVISCSCSPFNCSCVYKFHQKLIQANAGITQCTSNFISLVFCLKTRSHLCMWTIYILLRRGTLL